MAFWYGSIADCLFRLGHNPGFFSYQERRLAGWGGCVGLQEVMAMTVFSGFRLAFLIFALGSGFGFAGNASAQENLDMGKSPAQLYASNCAICHKSPAALSKAGGILGMDSFLRQHYTASRESATAIANYLKEVGTGPAAPVKKTSTKKSPKGEEKKGVEKKPDGAISLPGDNKPVETKPAETKASESKPVEAKPAEAAPAASKPAEKPAEPKTEPAASPKAD